MKVLFPVLLTIVIAFPAFAHPGKTDRQGGHKCYKECAEWDLYYAEYHLHDKDGKAVKVARKKTVRQKPASTLVEEKTVRTADSPAETTPSQPVVASAAAVKADVPFLPWILLLLLLLLLFVVRRNREKT